MAIRPVDLQQTIMKSLDVTRDTTVEQQAAASQQTQTMDHTRRRAEEAETVRSFEEEAAALLVRDRRPRSGEQDAQDAGEDEPEAKEDGQSAPREARQPGMGRHIDLQA